MDYTFNEKLINLSAENNVTLQPKGEPVIEVGFTQLQLIQKQGTHRIRTALMNSTDVANRIWKTNGALHVWTKRVAASLIDSLLVAQ